MRMAHVTNGSKRDFTSRDQKYRYKLECQLPGDPRVCLFLMLNPSTRDEKTRKGSHPTRSRCKNVAKKCGFGILLTCNLFAYRSPSTKKLWEQECPVEPPEERGFNDRHIREAVRRADMIVCAWGNGGRAKRRECLAERIQRVLEILEEEKAHDKLYGLYKERRAFTAKKQPVHPGWRALPQVPNRMQLRLHRPHGGSLKIEPVLGSAVEVHGAPASPAQVQSDELPRTVRRSVGDGPVSDEAYQRFWSAFLRKFDAKHPGWNRRARPSQKRPSIGFVAAGRPWRYRAGFHRGRLFVGVRPGRNTDAATVRKAYDELEKKRAEIAHAFGEGLEWDPPGDGRSNAGISVYCPDAIGIHDEECWQKARDWLIKTLENLQSAIDPVLEDLTG